MGLQRGVCASLIDPALNFQGMPEAIPLSGRGSTFLRMPYSRPGPDSLGSPVPDQDDQEG